MTELRAGAGEADITPFLGCQIDGNIGVPRPAEVVLTPLHARALVLEQNGKRFCFLSMDLLAITQEWTQRIRQMALEQFGFAPDAVAVHVTQCHSAPSLGQIMLSDQLPATKKYPWLRGSHPDYGPYALPRIEQAIRKAVENLQPVRVAWGAAMEDRVSFNRRYVMRDGTAAMGLGGRPAEDVLHREGPNDPEVGVATLTAANLQPVATLLHHTCHPVHWNPHRAVHADWPGRWCDAVRSDLLRGTMPLVVNGCCGNVIHGNILDRAREDTPQSMARLLTQTTEQALMNIHGIDDPVLRWHSETLRIPYRDFPPQVFADARRLIEANPEPIWKTDAREAVNWDWCFAASLLDAEEMVRTQTAFDYEIQAVRIGDLAILVLMGEPFVEGQLEIKRRSPAKRTFVAHMSNGYVGYIPTPHALKAGGYETRPSCGSKLCPEALQMIVDKSVEVLQKLYAN